MTSRLGVLYRGPLDSCNYACSYCPFAKRPARRAMLERDREALARFVAWATAPSQWNLEILFTPWGEALVWPWYREAIVALSHAPSVRQVSIQTNGTAPMDFLARADLSRVSLWISWHPTEIDAAPFVAKIAALRGAGVRLSVGAVAVPDRMADIEAMRAALPDAVPMWLNACKPGVRYDEAMLARGRAIDPAFDLDVRAHRPRGEPCLAGLDTVSVDGDGTVRRCHFVDDVLGNLYTDDLATMLRPRDCTRLRCDCWIGYSNLPKLGVRDAFASDGLLARIRRSASVVAPSE